jgi:NitT/TauT family transport system substrate-binding protein
MAWRSDASRTGVNVSDIPISREDGREVETACDQMNLLECLVMAPSGPTEIARGRLLVAANRTTSAQGEFFASAIAALENTGLTFRSFFDPEWHRLPDYSMAALNETILRDPKMIEGVVRGAVKASLFALTNPDCARRAQWTSYPSTKPSGADEATLVKWDLHFLESSLAGMKLALNLSGGMEWGKTTPEQFALLQDVFLKTKLIEKRVNPADYVIAIPDFFHNANTFDPRRRSGPG